MSPTIFSQPSSVWSVSIASITLAPSSIVHPGTDIKIVVSTLCGKEVVTIDAGVPRSMVAVEAARRAQITASIHHVLRRECYECRERLIQTLSANERRALWTENPKLGPILGLGATPGIARIITAAGQGE